MNVIEDRTGHTGIDIDTSSLLYGWLLEKQIDGTWKVIRRVTKNEQKDARNSYNLKVPIK